MSDGRWMTNATNPSSRDDHHRGHHEKQVLLLRPIPRRVVKPMMATTTIHPRMVADFSRECQGAGIATTPAMIQAAIESSQEWHRKWTFQQENGHTMPPSASIHDSSVTSSEAWRLEGAKNPSPSSGSSCSGGDIVDDIDEPDLQNEFLAMIQSPVLRPIATRPPMVPSPLLLPKHPSTSSESEAFDARYQVDTPDLDDPYLVQSHTHGHRMSMASSPLSLTSEQASVLSGITKDDESIMSLPAFSSSIEFYKEAVYHALAISGGDAMTDDFHKALKPLCRHYEELGHDARHHNNSQDQSTTCLEGMWLTVTKASYFGSLGENADGDPMYTLGRMAFDMFLPTQLVCSLQGNFNPVHVVPHDARPRLIPKNLVEEVEFGNGILRTYNIVTAFTIETHMADYPDAPNKHVRRPIKGIMTTYGYILPDPQVPNRLSIWFTGGKICPNNDEYDQREWNRLFSISVPKRTLGEKARVLAASLLMGAQVPTEMAQDGSMEYTFTRPLGGHGVAYVDILYLDSSLRIARGHRGTFFVFTRIPDDASFQ